MRLTKLQIKTVEKALVWAEQNLHPTKPRAWSCRQIEKHFGRRKIGQWLRQHLLITTKANWHFENYSECKEYCLNLVGMDIVRKSIGITGEYVQEQIIERISNQYAEELATGNFEYTTKSNRDHHGLQNVRKDLRTPVMLAAGYQYDYDLVCAAPTLLYQRALATGMTPLTLIPQYIENRNELRQYLADQYDIDIKAVKQVLTGLFQGGYISKWRHSHTYKILNGNYNHIERLRNDSFVQALSIEIKQMWKHIIAEMRLNGEFTEKRVLGKHKASIYRELEEEVMTHVKRYLSKNKIQFFGIHDGFQTKQVIDQTDLEVYVRNNTRYQINLERNVLTNKNKQTKAHIVCGLKEIE